MNFNKSQKYKQIHNFLEKNNISFYVIGLDVYDNYKNIPNLPADNITERVYVPNVIPYGPLEAQGTDDLCILLSRPKNIDINYIKTIFENILGKNYCPYIEDDLDWFIVWVLHVANTSEDYRRNWPKSNSLY